jgi:sugar phosphate isomerase/epimerase
MPPLRIAVDLSCLRLPFKQALLAAKRIGVEAVEIDARGEINPQELSQSGRRQLRKLLDDLDLRVAAVAFRTRRGYDAPQDLERRIEATKRAMEFAYSLGASLVVNQIGRVPDTQEVPAWTTLVEALTDLGGHGQHVGAALAAETGSESGADLARLLAALPAGSLAVCLNPGNLIINGYSSLDAVHSLGADIRYVHAKDGVRDLAQGRGVETPLGRGAADFPALCGALEEHGYRGYWTIVRERAENPLAEASQAASYLRSL